MNNVLYVTGKVLILVYSDLLMLKTRQLVTYIYNYHI